MGSEATLMWILVAMWQVMIGQNRLRASGPHIWVPFGWMGFVQRTGRICVWGLLSPCDISNSTPWAILIAWFIIQFLTALTGSFEWGVYGQINNFTQHALSPWWDWSCVIYLNKEVFPVACLWRWNFFYFCSKALIFPTLSLYWGKWQNYPYIFFFLTYIHLFLLFFSFFVWFLFSSSFTQHLVILSCYPTFGYYILCVSCLWSPCRRALGPVSIHMDRESGENSQSTFGN